MRRILNEWSRAVVLCKSELSLTNKEDMSRDNDFMIENQENIFIGQELKQMKLRE